MTRTDVPNVGAARPEDLLAAIEKRERQLQADAELNIKAGRNPFGRVPQALSATSPRRTRLTPTPRRGSRPRGAGRPARRTTARSSARSGDSGDDGPGEAPPAAREAVADVFVGILRRKNPNVSWEVAQ